MSKPTGRLAPSPTGLLHIGHARTFLLAWWRMRSAGGRILLRLEDLDQERVRPGMAEGILEDIAWLGMDWDGPIVRQSERGDLYRGAIDQLQEGGHLYPCVCTRKEIAAAQSAPHDLQEAPYPGTCLGRFGGQGRAAEQAPGSAALRFRVPPGLRSFEDHFAGKHEEDPTRSVGDFPVTRRGGGAAYQLAVVVDDAEQGVTEVLRGDDLVPSTIRQGLVQEALGLAPPAWVHVPLVLGIGGERLAKRSGDITLRSLRMSGVDAGDLVRWVAVSAGQEDSGPGLAGTFVDGFELGRLPRGPVAAWEPPAIRGPE